MAEMDNQLVALSSLSVGQKAVFAAFAVDTNEGQQIHSMVLAPGEQLEIIRLPPQGEFVEIKIREYFVSLPKLEADRIRVKLVH